MRNETYSPGRIYERVNVSVPVTVIAENGGARTSQVMSMLDVSEHGVRIRGHALLGVGQIAELIPNEGPRYGVRARVVWGKVIPGSEDGDYGLEFLANHPISSWEISS